MVQYLHQLDPGIPIEMMNHQPNPWISMGIYGGIVIIVSIVEQNGSKMGGAPIFLTNSFFIGKSMAKLAESWV